MNWKKLSKNWLKRWLKMLSKIRRKTKTLESQELYGEKETMTSVKWQQATSQVLLQNISNLSNPRKSTNKWFSSITLWLQGLNQLTKWERKIWCRLISSIEVKPIIQSVCMLLKQSLSRKVRFKLAIYWRLFKKFNNLVFLKWH